MKNHARLFVLALLCVLMPTVAHAQKHELALTGGGQFSSNQNFDVSTTGAIEGSYAHRLAHVPLAALYVELPVAGAFDATAKPAFPFASVAALRARFSAVYVAPGLKLKLAPELPLSPFVTVGVGAGHFSEDVLSVTGATISSRGETDALAQFGGGVDMKFLPFLSLRGQVRDYFSGVPGFGTRTTGRQHNVLVTAGLVLRF